MSAYIQFFLRGGDRFYPIATFNRSTPEYQFFDAPWEKIRPIKKSYLERVESEINEAIDDAKKSINKYERKISLISELEGSLEEKIEYINDYEDYIDEIEEGIKSMNNTLNFVYFLGGIIEEADDTKYYDSAETINPDEYVYVGIEVGIIPAVEDVE